MRTKNVKKILAIIVIMFLFIFDNYCIAFDYSKPYESNKNYCFSVEDTDSIEVNKLYFDDNVEIPHEFSLASRMNIPVANQGDLGLCDLFATLKSAETNFALNSGFIYNNLTNIINSVKENNPKESEYHGTEINRYSFDPQDFTFGE